MNALGEVVQEEWLRSGRLRPTTELDAFIVMPNHAHGVVILRPSAGGADSCPPLQPAAGPPAESNRPAPPQMRPRSLSSLVAQLKATAAQRINLLRGMPGAPVWQRNYYEHVIRSEMSLNAIRHYIQCNPWLWPYDRDNPSALAAVDRELVKRCGFRNEEAEFIVNYDQTSGRNR